MKRFSVSILLLAAVVLASASARAGVLAEKKKVDAYVEAAAKEPGAVKTPTGLIFRTLKPGDGPSPKAFDKVKVHYEGTFIDGTVFDSSIQRGEPIDFPLDKVIKCWSEGLQMMKVGEKAKLVCPPRIAYGDQGRPPKIPPGTTLVFEVELLEILH
jgi:FKBP-type peptidyl-prolyl cis-trans isomerase FkpA